MKPPSHLGRIAKSHFNRVVKILDEIGILTPSDCDAIALYAVTYDRWLQAETLIKEHGLITVSPNGYPQQSPYLSIANDCQKKMVQLLGELGMTPKARTRLKIEKPVEDDPLQIFLRQNASPNRPEHGDDDLGGSNQGSRTRQRFATPGACS
jgi:P27 family predicted phage terminase small subunit